MSMYLNHIPLHLSCLYKPWSSASKVAIAGLKNLIGTIRTFSRSCEQKCTSSEENSQTTLLHHKLQHMVHLHRWEDLGSTGLKVWISATINDKSIFSMLVQDTVHG